MASSFNRQTMRSLAQVWITASHRTATQGVGASGGSLRSLRLSPLQVRSFPLSASFTMQSRSLVSTSTKRATPLLGHTVAGPQLSRPFVTALWNRLRQGALATQPAGGEEAKTGQQFWTAWTAAPVEGRRSALWSYFIVFCVFDIFVGIVGYIVYSIGSLMTTGVDFHYQEVASAALQLVADSEKAAPHVTRKLAVVDGEQYVKTSMFNKNGVLYMRVAFPIMTLKGPANVFTVAEVDGPAARKFTTKTVVLETKDSEVLVFGDEVESQSLLAPIPESQNFFQRTMGLFFGPVPKPKLATPEERAAMAKRKDEFLKAREESLEAARERLRNTPGSGFGTKAAAAAPAAAASEAAAADAPSDAVASEAAPSDATAKTEESHKA